jgi:hypothetical protein
MRYLKYDDAIEWLNKAFGNIVSSEFKKAIDRGDIEYLSDGRDTEVSKDRPGAIKIKARDYSKEG